MIEGSGALKNAKMRQSKQMQTNANKQYPPVLGLHAGISNLPQKAEPNEDSVGYATCRRPDQNGFETATET